MSPSPLLNGQGCSPSDHNNTPARPACTECQRRKQKCNRQWPCNHCQKRKVADKCTFSHVATVTTEKTPASNIKKRSRVRDDDAQLSDSDDDGNITDFESLGYMHSHFFGSLPFQNEKKPKPAPRQYFKTAASCPPLQRALQTLPSRTTTDVLVQNFLRRANFHYYIIYPPSFLQEYRDWWADRYAGRSLGLQWTCLLLMICACSTQYNEIELQRRLEVELGETIDKSSARYHNAARELHGVIPVGHNHLLGVQQLMHSCLWYTSEARFVESWHVLAVAIREAQELGIHKERSAGPISEFDCEMRRRVWCVLDTWDWQISALLSRPRIIDRSECDVGQPSLSLEGHSPSPLLHMTLQSQLIGQLSNRFGVPKNATTPAEIEEYMSIVQRWIGNFPAEYNIEKPDRSKDSKHEWVLLHRHYLHTTSYSMMLDPIRPFLSQGMTRSTPREDLKIRDQGVNYALRLLDSLMAFFDHVYPEDAKFHHVLFTIFDTAAILCSAIMHDQDSSLQRRAQIHKAINNSISMLKNLDNVTRTAKTSHDILVRLMQRIAAVSEVPIHAAPTQNTRAASSDPSLSPPYSFITADASLSCSDVGSNDGAEYLPISPNDVLTSEQQPVVHHTSPSHGMDPTNLYAIPQQQLSATTIGYIGPHMMAMPNPQPNKIMSGMYMAPNMNIYMPPTSQESFDNFTAEGFSEEQLGDLANLWNYYNLDLNFIPQPQ